MTDSRGSLHLPPDGQSEQVSIDEPRDGVTGQIEDDTNRDIRRESPDGSENPGEGRTSGENNSPTEDRTNDATSENAAEGQIENLGNTQNESDSQPLNKNNQEESTAEGDQGSLKQELNSITDDKNNLPVDNQNEEEAETNPERATPEEEKDNEKENQEEKNNDEDNDKDVAKEEESQNEDHEGKDEKAAKTEAEKDASDTEGPAESKEIAPKPTTAQSNEGMRPVMTTPADDSGFTQPVLPAIPRGQAKVQQLAKSISKARNQTIPQTVIQPVRSRVPPKLMRLATVTVSPAKPPLRIDMEGPGPCSYSPLNKPLNETNAPAFTFGTKCSPEKPGLGARTSWAKSWFQSNHLYHQKADYVREGLWPSPNHYTKPGTVGLRQRTMYAAPSYTFGHKQAFSITKPGADKEPSPNDYERQNADKHILRRGPSFSHQFRREGTILWGVPETTPGPAAYVPLHSARSQRPAYTIQGIRREKSHILGPYSTM